MKKKNVFLIAYYFRPYKGVGMLRAAYWFDLLKAEGYNITLITAIPGENEPGVVRLPVNRHSKLLSASGLDDSFSWGIQVKRYLLNNHLLSERNTILFTGGPFLQINILPFLRRKYPLLNIIVDYRDPFARNPRFHDNWFKKSIKHWLEKRYNRSANSVITVNRVCEQLLVRPLQSSLIIDNGYDERLFGKVNCGNKDDKTVVYAGKFYQGTCPEILMQVLVKENMKFCYCGSSILPIKSENIHYYGQLHYVDVVKLLKPATIGVVLTGGDPFESTTKIFDYIGAKLKILIITNKEPYTGNIHLITQNNPNVEWAVNDSETIRSALYKLLSRDYVEWDHEQWSRYHGYCKLKTII